jgi:hypothetical protein
MNKRAIGALTMVLVGSVTFSLTNNLLANQSTNQLNEVNNLPISDEPKTADNLNSAEKKLNVQTKRTADKITKENNTLIEQTPVTDRKNVDTKVAIKPITLQAKSNITTTQVQNSTTTIRAASSTTKTTAPVTTKNATNQKPTTTTSTKTTTTAPTNSTTTSSSPTTTAPTNSTTTSSSPTTTGPTNSTTTSSTTTTASTTTNANHGQQVSQDAKAKAAIRKDQKVNNGKKN